MAAGPEMRGDHAEHRQEPLGCAGGAEAFHGAFAVPGRLVRVLHPVEFSTDVKCCDESGGRFMLVAERAMPWSAWRLLSWHARSARCVVGVCGGEPCAGRHGPRVARRSVRRRWPVLGLR